jgi:hypothetical protein
MAEFRLGSRGILIQRLRKSVGLPDIDPKPPSPETRGEPIIQPYDKALADLIGGSISEALYAVRVGEPFPPLFERALMVIAWLERHGYHMKIQPEQPTEKGRAGITMGLIGFQAHSGSLGRLLRDLVPADIGELQVFLNEKGITDQADQEGFLAYLQEKKEPRKKAMALFLTEDQKSVKPRWRTFLLGLLRTREGMKQQERHARKAYYDSASTPTERELGNHAEDAAALNGLTSELGLLLAFSACVQGGSLKNQQVSSMLSDRAQRIEIAIRRSRKAGKKSGFDQRHIQLAKGFGYPNRSFVDLAAWGFEPDPPPPAASRILTLAFSDAPSMMALTKFETAALASAPLGLEESVLQRKDIQALLTDAGTPQGAAAIPNFAKAWDPSRTAYLRLFAQLDELPIDCLVLGGRIAGITIGGATQLLVKNNIVSWKNADYLNLPFVPRMRNGLVVLFSSRGLPEFGRLLQDAIGAIDGSKPLILGWQGPISAFPGLDGVSCADAFFTALAGAAKKLPELIATAPETVIQAWGKACHDTFAKTFPALWRVAEKKKPLIPISACAARAPNGDMWLAMAKPENNTIFMKKK